MYEIIKRPIVTEKNTLLTEKQNVYAFWVSNTANRSQIKKAVEKLFGVKVLRVNTLVSRQEGRRLGRFVGKRQLWKKAYVKLKEGDKFEFVAA